MKHSLMFLLFAAIVGSALSVWQMEESGRAEVAQQNRLQAAEEEAAESHDHDLDRDHHPRHAEGHHAHHPTHQAADREREMQVIRQKVQELERYRKRIAMELAANHPELLLVAKQIETMEAQFKALANLEHGEQNHRQQIARKIEHLRAASEHVEQAGMPDLARELRNQAENLERERNQQPGDPGGHEGLRELMEQMRDMKQELQKLRSEVAELRGLLQKVD
jgi:cell division protein FtsL